MAKKGEVTDKTAEIEGKMKDLEDQLKRAVADYRNLERRVHEDSQAIAQYSKAQLVVKVLPVLDSLDQAVSGALEAEQNSGWLKGVLMSIKQLRQVLSEEGLVEVDASGQFNPELHEAVDVRVSSDAEAMEGKGDGSILEVVQRGYTLNGKVIRPARVVVGKAETKEEVKTKEA